MLYLEVKSYISDNLTAIVGSCSPIDETIVDFLIRPLISFDGNHLISLDDMRWYSITLCFIRILKEVIVKSGNSTTLIREGFAGLPEKLLLIDLTRSEHVEKSSALVSNSGFIIIGYRM